MPNRAEPDRALLAGLLACHATPGDEAEVRDLLEQRWRRARWPVRRLGDFAVLATAPHPPDSRAPLLLVCAHMDSPGYAVHALPRGTPRRRLRSPAWPLTALGGPAFPGATAAGRLKCAAGLVPVTLRQAPAAPGADDGTPAIVCTAPPADAPQLLPSVRHGDRVCFAASPVIEGDRIVAPFLDNRLGCWIVAELPRLAARWRAGFRIVVAATSAEEFTGHGAAVLAHHLRPDLTLVIDATYANPEQQVVLGGGPVLTLSDRSVLISPARREALAGAFARAAIPLQTEVYNFSGTDARAFPLQGVFTPVLPLLIATTGNHTPRETADLRDAATLLRAIRLLAEGAPVVAR
jgi:putative aminopeptidase FrvX